jgi:hypothetical protein
MLGNNSGPKSPVEGNLVWLPAFVLGLPERRFWLPACRRPFENHIPESIEIKRYRFQS